MNKEKKRPALKALSAAQFARIRDALRAYHRYGRDIDGRYYTWRDVREAIAVYTGTEIGASAKLGAERLRQFVEGVEDKRFAGSRMFPTPKPEAVEAIYEFVTHEELNLLSEDELTEDSLETQAPLRFFQFLQKSCTLLEYDDNRFLEGQYFTVHKNRDGWTTRSVFLDRLHKDGILRAVESRKHYHNAQSEEQAMEWETDFKKPANQEKFFGWAVLTPEDSLMIFLKRERDGKNHRYICLEEVRCWLAQTGTVIAPVEAQKGIKVLMMEHEFGNDLREADIQEIVKTFRNDLFTFSKLSDGPA